jgi:hypothetical protein
VTCTAANFCAAVDSAGELVTWNGTHWSKPRVVDNGGDLRSVSCVNATFCAASGDAALILRYRGKSWSAQVAHVSGVALGSVSCASETFCVAGDLAGDVYIWNGARWRGDGQPSPDAGIAVSCRSARFCAGVTGAGEGLFYAQRPEVLTRSLPNAVRTHLYSAKLKVTAGVAPYTFSAVSAMPPGLKLTTNGTVTGKPKKDGHFTIRVSARDPLGERTNARVSLTVL